MQACNLRHCWIPYLSRCHIWRFNGLHPEPLLQETQCQSHRVIPVAGLDLPPAMAKSFLNRPFEGHMLEGDVLLTRISSAKADWRSSRCLLG